MAYDPTVTVCNVCMRACCWQGEFMCGGSQGAGTVRRKISTLLKVSMKLNGYEVGEPCEHPDWWNNDLRMNDKRLLTADDLQALGLTDKHYMNLSPT